MATENDEQKIAKIAEFKTKFMTEMVKCRAMYEEDKTNDYMFFLYSASILNYIEYHNEGSLTDLGMKSLSLNIAPYLVEIQEDKKPLSQKDMVRFLLNILNSYAVTVLVMGLIEFSKEEPTFFEINEFPLAIKDDFNDLLIKCKELSPKLKSVLDRFTPVLEQKYARIFNEEKTKGFYKPIFATNVIRQNTGLPPNIDKAIHLK